eukprot:11543102-Ditylum_brightwellii.AAC.1
MHFYRDVSMIGSGKAGDVLQQVCFRQGLGQVGNVGRPYLLMLHGWKDKESYVKGVANGRSLF